MVCGCGNAQDIGGWTAEKRDAALRKALGTGVSIRQLSGLTGISKAIIERIAKNVARQKNRPRVFKCCKTKEPSPCLGILYI